jgi:hypothetical protein
MALSQRLTNVSVFLSAAAKRRYRGVGEMNLMVVNILNIVTKYKILFVCELRASKVCVHFLGHTVCNRIFGG